MSRLLLPLALALAGSIGRLGCVHIQSRAIRNVSLLAVAILLVALFVSGCAQMSAVTSDLAKVESAIESKFGIDVETEWEIVNGELVSVGIVFYTLPADAPNVREFMRIVTDLVKENLKQEPGYIYIQYVSEGVGLRCLLLRLYYLRVQIRFDAAVWDRGECYDYR